MTTNTEASPQPSGLWQNWRGLSGWNYYFLIKFGLLWYGYLNFHPLANLVFMAFLLFPLPEGRLRRWRNWLALPIGFALFYHDTWLPGLNSILSQGSQLAGFTSDYLLDLANRFINWQMIGAVFVLLVAYLFVSQWVRITPFVVAAMVWLNVLTIAGPAFSLAPEAATNTAGTGAAAPAADGGGAQAAASGDIPAQTEAPTSKNLSAWLDTFYASEQQRQTAFPASLPADAQPFDLLVINICSLAWSDIDSIGLSNHPLWSHFDILFKNFNSATAYSGPASIRLLRASCGQPSHKALYSPAGQQCYLFDNLAKLGFKSELIMDHSGVFGNYLDGLRKYAGLQAPLMSQSGIGHELTSFDGEPIYNDQQVLQRWLDAQEKDDGGRTATFFNLIPLHDGNRFIGQSKTADYKTRAQTLFDQLNNFLNALEKSGRKVMVVIVPEHGAALVGDKMQMSGLRDIPSPGITHVPVGIKFVGMKTPHQGAELTVDAPSSFLALSELVARTADGKIFTQDNVDWNALVKGLPQSAAVSENDNAIVIQYQGKPYIRLNGGDWVPYPH
ncbi:cellulose biosynthesis protein BcsG [Enterobacillus tribolii]|uniref:Cellulose synthase operon protein YhjU n=1 Tax=Enterobacillus tribolii TaxID=1487935 RepID=A0A370QU86_9GAMM|nr:cellulose biosynthesis protein BcsG [Enterobacillus tribolii]MBW7981128.1 cellulose biosynthesis protein BcsG [Enterobacillus tribolii]RDK92814.1 cellulose synthase operon protein YhjU [Enterobacillus tribolii]